MPIDARIPMGIDASTGTGDWATPYQQGFNAVQVAPLQKQTAESNLKTAQLKQADQHLSTMSDLLSGVRDEQSYQMQRNKAIQLGIAKPEELPEQYNPAEIEGWKSWVGHQRQLLDDQYKKAQIEQMNQGGSTGVLLNRLQTEPGLMDTYLGKANASKGLKSEGGKITSASGYDESLEATERAKAKGRAEGKAVGETKGEAEAGLSDFVATTEAQLFVIDQMIGNKDAGIGEHPGLEAAVGGVSSKLPSLRDDTVDFEALLEQARSGAFLTSIKQLQGMGALSNAEGQVATAAATRMKNATSEDGFRKAAAEYREQIRKGVDRMRNKAGVQSQEVEAPMNPQVKFLGYE